MLKNKSYYLILLVLIAVIVLLPFKYSVSVNSRGKLFAYQTWTLAKEANGLLTASLTDNSTGINSELSITQFERGDAYQFNLNNDILNKHKVSKGDTVGFVISNVIQRDIEKLKGALETAKASLQIQVSSEKESVIEAEKKRLNFAEKELEEQTKIYTRKKKLFERELISQQEFEADEARYELAKINIDIAKEALRIVQSGEKQEAIRFAESQIKAIENEINVLQSRFESNIIISPISGLLNRIFSADTLFMVNDVSKSIIVVPVQWGDASKIILDQKVYVSAVDIEVEIEGRVLSIDNTVRTINNMQYVFVTVVSDNKIENMKHGLNVDCKIACGEETFINIIIDFFKPVIR